MGSVRIELTIRDERYEVERNFHEIRAYSMGGRSIVSSHSDFEAEIESGVASLMKAEKRGRGNA